MKANRRILLYGNSVILGTVGASLRRHPHFDVVTLATPLQEVMALRSKSPGVILFDLEASHTEAIFSLLKADPSLMLIGISPGINMVEVWSGREMRKLSMQDLIELIKSPATDSPVESSMGDGDCSYQSAESK